jgi:hypothetical protein
MSFDNEEPFSFTSAAPSLDRKRCEKIVVSPRFLLDLLHFFTGINSCKGIILK